MEFTGEDAMCDRVVAGPFLIGDGILTRFGDGVATRPKR